MFQTTFHVLDHVPHTRPLEQGFKTSFNQTTKHWQMEQNLVPELWFQAERGLERGFKRERGTRQGLRTRFGDVFTTPLFPGVLVLQDQIQSKLGFEIRHNQLILFKLPVTDPKGFIIFNIIILVDLQSFWNKNMCLFLIVYCMLCTRTFCPPTGFI